MQIDVSALKSIFNPKLRPLIGVDISSTAVKMVELVDAGKGQPRVERYAIESLPKEAVLDGNLASLEAVAETLQRCWKRLGTSTRFVALALPTSAVITKKITLPANLREQDMEIQVESEANQYIPFALEEVNLDFQVIGPAPGSPDDVEVLLAASRKEKVEDRVAAAEVAELKPVVMDVEAYAIQAAYELVIKQLPKEGAGQIIALIDVGAAAMKVTIMKDDQQIYGREQAFGGSQLTDEIMRVYGMGADEAENLKRSGTPPDNYEAEILHPFIENMAQEVARALQFFFTSTPFSEVNHIILAGGSALVPGVAEIVGQRTNVNTILADPFAGMAISPRIRAKQLAADAPSLMVACGLALRKFDQ
ncbi:pilus assembly protein PilM [Sulfuritalea hydrogenivorans]|uniref:Type IV pilus assembly protein PilM n=1 Tax=Sulfuritalea hydrogenivorans sk43H TaxID=1223802 RepID=W0SB19_9PROT|nr:pilus assembly protein PilM [Sulfuritalea hydrogenivorans]MDK9715309.1 pilus assembly protein PilM [Sulfuritalea sp.]BAO28399.1 type IV pilus assembly protein PilM [Sulfuritalea hydrogenivorans sk43H]